MTWELHWQGGDDGFVAMELDRIIEQLEDDCRALVDLCEQEILEGGHWDDRPHNQTIRKEHVSRLIRSVGRQTGHVILEDGGTIKFNPEWAVRQGEAYTVWMRKRKETSDG